MSASRHLNPAQFSFRPGISIDAGNSSVNSLEAYHPKFKRGKKPVGSIEWLSNSKEIQWVNTNKRHARQGIATKLYQEASSQLGEPLKHSPALSDEGRNWARKIGGPSV